MHRRAVLCFLGRFLLGFSAQLYLALLVGQDGCCTGRIPTFLPTGEKSCFINNQNR